RGLGRDLGLCWLDAGWHGGQATIGQHDAMHVVELGRAAGISPHLVLVACPMTAPPAQPAAASGTAAPPVRTAKARPPMQPAAVALEASFSLLATHSVWAASSCTQFARRSMTSAPIAAEVALHSWYCTSFLAYSARNS